MRDIIGSGQEVGCKKEVTKLYLGVLEDSLECEGLETAGLYMRITV